MVPVVDILLDILAVGVHGSQLVDLHQPASAADAQQVDHRTVGRVFMVEGGSLFLSGNAIHPVVADLGTNGESRSAEASHDLGAAHHQALPLGQGGPHLPEGRQFGQHAHHQVIAEVIEAVDQRWIFMQDTPFALLGGFGAHHQATSVLQTTVGHLEEVVDVFGTVQRVEADDGVVALLGKGEERGAVGRVDDQTAVIAIHGTLIGHEGAQCWRGFFECRHAQQGLSGIFIPLRKGFQQRGVDLGFFVDFIGGEDGHRSPEYRDHQDHEGFPDEQSEDVGQDHLTRDAVVVAQREEQQGCQGRDGPAALVNADELRYGIALTVFIFPEKHGDQDMKSVIEEGGNEKEFDFLEDVSFVDPQGPQKYDEG